MLGCFAFSTTVPKNGPKNGPKFKKCQKMTKTIFPLLGEDKGSGKNPFKKS